MKRALDPRGLTDTAPEQKVDPDAANRLAELTAGALESAHLTELSLKKAGLKALPSAVQGLKQLTKLDVSLNALDDFPPELAVLAKLRTLFCLGCRFQAVPEVVGQVGASECSRVAQRMTRMHRLTRCRSRPAAMGREGERAGASAVGRAGGRVGSGTSGAPPRAGVAPLAPLGLGPPG